MNIIERSLNFILREIHLLYINDFRSIEGWLTDYEAWALFHYANKVKNNGIIVEIGSWKGKSTYCLAKGAAINSRVIAIDPFDAYGEKESSAVYKKLKGSNSLYKEFINNMKSRGVMDKIIPKKGYSKKFINTIDHIDLLFIDGDHSFKGCKFDFDNYSPKLSKGGIIAFHDYRPDQKNLGPVRVVEKHVKQNKSYKFVGLYNSLWIAEKIANEKN